MVNTAEDWIHRLALEPHPEGGWYREVYRAGESIPQNSLPSRFSGDRAFATAIYFLLARDEFSALHRIRQDELWHFYDGGSLTLHLMDDGGAYSRKTLGRDIDKGSQPLVVVPAGCWFGATLDEGSAFALVGCTVAPGFDFDDFELPSRAELLAKFPQHREIVTRVTN